MADYFTNFSLVLTLKDATQQQYALDLAAKAEAHRFRDSEEPAPDDVPSEFVDVLDDWSFEVDQDHDNSIWLHSVDGGIDAVCVFIQHLLKKFNSEDRVELEWAHDCSKPRVDAYGGGAAIITAENITTMNTSQWLRQQLELSENQSANPQEKVCAAQAPKEQLAPPSSPG